MKTIALLGVMITGFIGLSQPTWAGPHGNGGGFGGGGFAGAARSGGGHFSGGGIRAAPGFSGGARFGGGFRAAPAFQSRGAYFTGRNTSGPSSAPRFYYGRGGVPNVKSQGFTASGNRSITPNTRRPSAISGAPNRAGSLTRQNTRGLNSQVGAANRQSNRMGTIAGQNRVSNPRNSTAANRQSFLRNHAFEHHDGNWHRGWDKRHAHFDHNRVFVFVNGFWWGLYPGDYYPYYASGYDPYDYSESYPYDSSTYPYGYYGGYNPNDYYQDNNDNGSTNAPSDQYASNPTVGAVQSELAKLGYYNGAIDGVLGDQTEAALARYQQDRDLSVSGTLDPATLQSLGLAQTGN